MGPDDICCWFQGGLATQKKSILWAPPQDAIVANEGFFRDLLLNMSHRPDFTGMLGRGPRPKYTHQDVFLG